jgi:hypothetical protein
VSDVSERKDKPRSTIFVAEADRWLGTTLRGEREARDPVDRALEEAAERKVRRLKMLELDKYLLETEKEIKQLKGEEAMEREKGEGKEDPLLVPWAMELSKLPDDQRNKVISIVHALRGGRHGSELAWIVPIALGVTRANPGESVDSLVKVAETMANQIKTGFEIARQQQAQPQSNTNPLEMAVQFIKALGEMVREDVRKPLEEAVAKIQPQPSALEQILMDDKLFERAKELGLFGGRPQEGLTTEAALRLQKEIEQLKTERDVKIEELKQAHEKWKMEMQAEMHRWEQVGKILQGPVGQFVQMIGGATADRIRGQPQAQKGSAPPGVQVEQISCPSCQKQFYVNALADYAVCPFCAMVLQKKLEGEASGEQPADVK